MLSIFPQQTQENIEEARKALNSMGAAKNGFELNPALRNFLDSARFCFHPLKQQNFGKTKDFDSWWSQKDRELKNDPLCIFFRDLRNDVVKKGVKGYLTNFKITGPVQLRGPLMIGLDGIALYQPDNRGKLRAKSYPGVELNDFQWEFFRKPPGFEQTDSIILAENYLSILEKVLDGFIERFVEGKE